MPSERFYRLSEEKQKAIRRAALKEFARVPIDKVSINRIIKDADISRGSFYTYFEDKWDMRFYIFEDGHKQMKQFCIESMTENKGDVWKMLVDFLDYIISHVSNNDTFELIKNVMAHANSDEMFSEFSTGFKHCNRKPDELELWLFENTDKRDFNCSSFEEFHCFMMIAMSCMTISMREFYQGAPKEKIVADFSKRLELLRYGVCSTRTKNRDIS